MSSSDIRVQTQDLADARVFAAQAPHYLLEVAAAVQHAFGGAAAGAERPELAAELEALSQAWTPVIRRMAGEAQYIADGLDMAIQIYDSTESANAGAMTGGVAPGPPA